MRFCTIREADGTRQTGQCQLCGDAIYEGEEYYHINGTAFCVGCLEDYAQQHFAAFLRRGGERV